MLKDDYIVYINRDNSRHYLKNGLFHRENGPAIIGSIDKDKYLNLGDEHFYKELCSIYPYEAYYHEEDDLWEYPLSVPTRYYLNGIKYSKEEFYARKLQKELNQELSKKINFEQIKKTKL
jgi:hypothetical protein